VERCPDAVANNDRSRTGELDVSSNFDVYQSRTEGDILVVVLSPA
jgi:hypothetical protein